MVDCAGLDGRSRHPEKLRRRFVLSHHSSARLFHCHSALCTVATHAREHDHDRRTVDVLGERLEEDVRGRPLETLRCRIEEREPPAGADDQVRVGGSDVDRPRPSRLPVLGLLHGQSGRAVEYRGQQVLAARQLMLHDQDRQREVVRNGPQHGRQRRQSTG